MAAYFQLINKSTGKADSFQLIDDNLRKHLGVEPNDEFWYNDWYDILGLAAAVGKTWEQMWDLFPDHQGEIDYLADHYDISCWAGR